MVVTWQRLKKEMRPKKERLVVLLVFLVLIAGGTCLPVFGDESLQEDQSLILLGKMVGQLEGIDEKLANVEARLGSMEARLGSVEARLSNIDLGFSNHLSEHTRRSDRWFEILIVGLMIAGLLMIRFVPRPQAKK